MFSLKRYIRDAISILLLLIFKKSALKRFNNHVLSIYFHNPSPVLFKSIVRFLKAYQFKFISEKEYLEIVEESYSILERMVFISFDDGWKGNLKLIKTIEKYQIPVSFFIPVEPVVTGNFWWEYTPAVLTDNINFLSVEDLKKISNSERLQLINSAISKYDLKRSCVDLNELKSFNKHPLITIGSHTYHHPITLNCSNEELDFEYRESKKTLEKWLDTEIQSFSYPNGDFDQRDINLLKECGYKMAFTTNPNLSIEGDVFQIPRVSINSNGGTYENIARMLGVWHRFVQPFKLIRSPYRILKINFSKT
ncbi:polysaccharide deacetylase family protein [Marinifilum sp. N1E240]|uniref:polysaccharide deacetylase family protein n=1 Tax=Marinifilum sp. N1E240 TaxID=2608082 RepID=UPI00128B2608|nr:polysaccharide deacetylase family protein [Marinifilum sp. N1E240]MPQ46328.1 polysaccharide deacetylase family protein [Marinifilum sp. N1E240]